MMIFILLLAVVGLYYPGNDGALVVSAVVLYALTACVGGFVSGYFYKQMGGTAWVWNTVLVATIFALPFVVIAFIINIIAVAYQSLNAIPFEAVLAVIAIWAFGTTR
jgi:transmembrane 9 superfamily protein 2/4